MTKKGRREKGVPRQPEPSGKAPVSAEVHGGRRVQDSPSTGSIMHECVRWSFKSVDLFGPYGWSKFARSLESTLDLEDPTIAAPVWKAVEDVVSKLAHFERKRWCDIFNERHRHHASPISRLKKEARDRLVEIGRTDVDELFSFRLTGPHRIWVIRYEAEAHLLWWDPDHDVYDSKDR